MLTLFIVFAIVYRDLNWPYLHGMQCSDSLFLCSKQEEEWLLGVLLSGKYSSCRLCIERLHQCMHVYTHRNRPEPNV